MQHHQRRDFATAKVADKGRMIVLNRHADKLLEGVEFCALIVDEKGKVTIAPIKIPGGTVSVVRVARGDKIDGPATRISFMRGKKVSDFYQDGKHYKCVAIAGGGVEIVPGEV